MTENAANALLKTLEEPNPNRLFLLVANKSQLLPTIISRCQLLTLPAADKSELQKQYPDVPDYVLSYSEMATGKVEMWQQEGTITTFETVYSAFICGLKGVSQHFL